MAKRKIPHKPGGWIKTHTYDLEYGPMDKVQRVCEQPGDHRQVTICADFEFRAKGDEHGLKINKNHRVYRTQKEAWEQIW